MSLEEVNFTPDILPGGVETSKKTNTEIMENDSSNDTVPRFSSACSVLVVEDDGPSREVLALFLIQLGISVRVAKSGEECLALVEAQAPDLVLLDFNLPGINGLDTATLLRINPDLPELTLVALTADDLSLPRSRALQEGFDD